MVPMCVHCWRSKLSMNRDFNTWEGRVTRVPNFSKMAETVRDSCQSGTRVTRPSENKVLRQSQRAVPIRFMVPMHAQKRKGALHEPLRGDGDLEGWSSSFSLRCTTASQNKLKL